MIGKVGYGTTKRGNKLQVSSREKVVLCSLSEKEVEKLEVEARGRVQ